MAGSEHYCFQISISNVPGLVNLLREGEELADLMKLSPEQILLRWVNHQLEKVLFVMLDMSTCRNVGRIIKENQELP